MIIAHIKPDHRTWDNDLIEIIWTYNTSVHETTGYTLFYLCYGRNPELSPTIKRSAEHKAALEYAKKTNKVRQIAQDNQKQSTKFKLETMIKAVLIIILK